MASYDKYKEQQVEAAKPPLISEWKEYFQQGFKIFSRNNEIREKNDLTEIPPVEIKIDNANDFSFKEEGEIQNRSEKENDKKFFDLNSIEVKESEPDKDFSPIKDSKEFKEFKDYKDYKELKESKEINEVNEISFANNRFSFEELKPQLTEAKKLNFSLSNISMSNSLSNLNNINERKSIELDKLTEIKEHNINDSFTGIGTKMINEKISMVESIDIDAKIDIASNDVINEVFQNKYATKNKDKEIKNLEDKLTAYKYQNRIMLEENNKLLEIINLFKILQNMEKENETVPIVKYETEKEIISAIKKIAEVDTETEAKIEVEKEQSIHLPESTKETTEEVNPMRKISEEKKIHQVEMDRIINYSLFGANSSPNSSLKRDAPKAQPNIIVGNENICIKGEAIKFAKSANNKAAQCTENSIENQNDICNVASISPMMESTSKNMVNMQPNKMNLDKMGNSNYLSFRDFPDNSEKNDSTQNKLSSKGKTFIDTAKAKKGSYGKIYQNIAKANDKEIEKNKQPSQSQSGNNNTHPMKSYIRINNNQAYSNTLSNSNYNSTNSINNTNSKSNTNNQLLMPVNNNFSSFKDMKPNDARSDDINSKISNTDYNNIAYLKSRSSANIYDNQRAIETESKVITNRYDNNIDPHPYQQEDHYNTLSSHRKYTIDPNSSGSKSNFRAKLKRDRENLTVANRDNQPVNRANTEDNPDKDEKYSYNRIIKMLERYREMNEKLISNLNDKNDFYQPVIIDVEKRKKGVDNLKEILEYISTTKTLEEKKEQIIPFYLIDKRKLYENIVNYIFYNRDSNTSTSISALNKSSSSSNFSARKLNKFKS